MINETQPWRNWSLIQRLYKAQYTDGKSGIDNVVGHDYMGSAEFEFGAVPVAWAKMRLLGAKKEMLRLETPFVSTKDKPFYCIAPKALDADHVFNGIKGCSTKAFYTKDYTHMDAWLPKAPTDFTRPGADYGKRTTGWIALNAFVFWTVDKTLADGIWREVDSGYCGSPNDVQIGELVRTVINGKQRNGLVKEIIDETLILSLSSDNNVVSVLYDEVYKPVRK